MKRNSGIYLILSSLVFSVIGSVLKIRHAGGADLFLAIGIVFFVIGIGTLLYSLRQKKST